MSGAITASTIIAGIGAAAAVGSTAYGVYSGEKQAGVQQQQLQNQKNAQQTAEQNALSQERKSDMAQNAANQKTPDIAGILARAANASKVGVSSTMLTGPSGIDPTSLNLGKSSLLGS